MEYKRGRYSWVLRPFLIAYDITILNVFAYYFFNLNDKSLYFFSYEWLNDKHLIYALYSSSLWLLSTYFLKFYKVYRYTSLINIISLLMKQFLAYVLIVFAFIGMFRSLSPQASITIKYLLFSFIAIGFMKLLSYFMLKTYRSYLNGNIRRVIIVGGGVNTIELRKVFSKKNYGYNLIAVFSESQNKSFKEAIKDSFKFLQENQNVDEIYCAIDELEENQVNEYIKYGKNNRCNIKFIPSKSEIYSKRGRTDYYDYLPVFSFQEVSLNDSFNKIVKRLFDIIFSSFVIVFLLSWLAPLLAILIKTESSGPVFFKHKRTGLNYEEFTCYKFRSLMHSKEIDLNQVKFGDNRVTKIGKFIRKTSLDELPQFYNVLFGDMSVVGPRPHMIDYTQDYAKIIDKYNFMFRHHVKPGITGLAQIKGYRGEIKLDKDIINRIKYDIFYIENWSLLLDLKIIFKTFMNVLKGEEMAY